MVTMGVLEYLAVCHQDVDWNKGMFHIFSYREKILELLIYCVGMLDNMM